LIPSATSTPNGPHCAGCPSRPTGVRYIPMSGTGSSGIMAVADSPWVDEVKAGFPFAGAAGAMLDRLLRKLAMDRADLTLTNAHHCKPRSLGFNDYPERFPEASAAIEQCRPHLDDEIERMRPRVLFAMGNVALRRLTGATGVESRHSYVHSTSYGIPCIPTFHPSFLMQGNHKLSPCFLFALRRASEIADGLYRPTSYNLMLDPSVDDLKAYLNCFPRDLNELCIDIETPESPHLDEEETEEKGASFAIIRWSFSLEDGTGVSVPHEYPYTAVLRDLLSRSAVMLEYTESFFDSKRLRASGYPIPSTLASPMWAWHFLQSDLPKGLGFVAPFYYAGPPWKHLSDQQPAFYSAMDAAAMQSVWLGVRGDLQRQGRWESFMTHCIEVDRLYVRASLAGVRINRESQEALRLKLEAERDEVYRKLQSEVPLSVRPIKQWRKPPKDMTGVTSREMECECVTLGLNECRRCKGSRKVTVYEKPLDFNPRSSPQVIALMRFLGVPVPKNRKEDRETTEAKHLKKLSKKHPVFRTILDYRERDKLVTAYIWPLDDQGLIHPTIGHHPSTWRKSMRNPNAQTIPKRNDLAKAFRKLIESETAALEQEPGATIAAGVMVGGQNAS